MTLESLEKGNFGDPSRAPTGLAERCLRLCKVPLEKFTVDDLRLMITQQFSLSYLIPLAMEHLEADLLVEALYFPGDLLKSVLSVDPGFWTDHKTLAAVLSMLIANRRDELAARKISTEEFDEAVRINNL